MIVTTREQHIAGGYVQVWPIIMPPGGGYVTIHEANADEIVHERDIEAARERVSQAGMRYIKGEAEAGGME